MASGTQNISHHHMKTRGKGRISKPTPASAQHYSHPYFQDTDWWINHGQRAASELAKARGDEPCHVQIAPSTLISIVKRHFPGIPQPIHYPPGVANEDRVWAKAYSFAAFYLAVEAERHAAHRAAYGQLLLEVASDIMSEATAARNLNLSLIHGDKEMDATLRRIEKASTTILGCITPTNLSLSSHRQGNLPLSSHRQGEAEEREIRNNDQRNGSAQERNNRNFTNGMDSRMKNVVMRLENVGIDVNLLDLSKKENFDRVKDTIGDLFALQKHFAKEEKGKKHTSTFEYFKPGCTHTSYAISLIPHGAREKAFDRYHRTTPYIKEFIKVMNIDSDNSGIGAKRLAQYLAKNHKRVYVNVGNDYNFGMGGIMNEIETAAMFGDAGLTHAQARTILKHLRYKFQSKITCPFKNIHRDLIDDPLEPGEKPHQFRKEGRKRKRFESNEEIQKQIKLVHAATARGKYKTAKTSQSSTNATTTIESSTPET